MIASLLLGAVLVAATFAVHTAGLVLLSGPLRPGVSDTDRVRYLSQGISILFLVLGLFLLIMVEVALWAVAFLAAGLFEDLETALYFSTSTFATVGFGDVAPTHDWRLLAAIEGIAGFLIIGWSGAYLVSASVRVGPFRKGVHF